MKVNFNCRHTTNKICCADRDSLQNNSRGQGFRKKENLTSYAEGPCEEEFYGTQNAHFKGRFAQVFDMMLSLN